MEQLCEDLDRDTGELESELVRRCIGALEDGRDRCADCGRTPLAGEHVHVYGRRRRRLVCELCSMLRSERPLASELVRDAGHGRTVRITRAA